MGTHNNDEYPLNIDSPHNLIDEHSNTNNRGQKPQSEDSKGPPAAASPAPAAQQGLHPMMNQQYLSALNLYINHFITLTQVQRRQQQQQNPMPAAATVHSSMFPCPVIPAFPPLSAAAAASPSLTLSPPFVHRDMFLQDPSLTAAAYVQHQYRMMHQQQQQEWQHKETKSTAAAMSPFVSNNHVIEKDVHVQEVDADSSLRSMDSSTSAMASLSIKETQNSNDIRITPSLSSLSVGSPSTDDEGSISTESGEENREEEVQGGEVQDLKSYCEEKSTTSADEAHNGRPLIPENLSLDTQEHQPDRVVPSHPQIRLKSPREKVIEYFKLLQQQQHPPSSTSSHFICNRNMVPSPSATVTGSSIDQAPVAKPKRERWTIHEHELLLQGLKLYGRRWKKIQRLLPHKNPSQIRVRAYGYFNKLALAKQKAAAAAAGTTETAQQKQNHVINPQGPPTYARSQSTEVAEILKTMKKEPVGDYDVQSLCHVSISRSDSSGSNKSSITLCSGLQDDDDDMLVEHDEVEEETEEEHGVIETLAHIAKLYHRTRDHLVANEEQRPFLVEDNGAEYMKTNHHNQDEEDIAQYISMMAVCPAKAQSPL